MKPLSYYNKYEVELIKLCGRHTSETFLDAIFAEAESITPSQVYENVPENFGLSTALVILTSALYDKDILEISSMSIKDKATIERDIESRLNSSGGFSVSLPLLGDKRENNCQLSMGVSKPNIRRLMMAVKQVARSVNFFQAIKELGSNKEDEDVTEEKSIFPGFIVTKVVPYNKVEVTLVAGELGDFDKNAGTPEELVLKLNETYVAPLLLHSDGEYNVTQGYGKHIDYIRTPQSAILVEV